MKRFLVQVFFLFMLASTLAVALALSAYRASPPKRFGPEVFRAIRVCTATKPDVRVLVLGDSVANQIFATGPALPPEVAVATCNQAVTALGNRILLDRWLALNPQTEEVIYAILPGGLRNDGARVFSFHYWIYPFAEKGLLDDATDEVREHLARRFGRLVLSNASLRHLLYRNKRFYEFYERHLIRVPASADEGIPDIVAEQLRAMKNSCAACGVRFRLVFLPTAPAAAPSAAFRLRVAERLRDIFPDIDETFDACRTEPDDHFRDGIHFTEARLSEIRESLRAETLARSVGDRE